MPKNQSVKFGEVAGFVLSSAAGVLIQLNQPWLGEHSRAVMGLYAMSLVFGTLLISQTAWVKKLLGEADGEPASLASAPVMNSASSSGNKIEQHFHGATPASLVEVPSSKPTQIVPTYPTFHWRFRYAKVSGLNDIWREIEGGFGYQSLIADVSAELPAAGKTVRTCALYGAVKFVGVKPENTGFLNRLCWLREPMNEMDFEVGKSATLFILCFEADESLSTPVWKAFRCKENRVADHPFNRSSIGLPKDFGRMTIPVDGAPTVVISLVDANTGFVVDTRTVRLTVSNSKFEIEEVSAH